jgi:hypothetical protein
VSSYVDEATARRRAVVHLERTRGPINLALSLLYDNASGYAGEVESVKEAVESAIRILNGEAVE